jgi:uncharacterized protein with PIN domain
VPTAEFRFYAALNDFLQVERRQRALAYAFTGTPSVKDAIEAIGVPHTEVDIVVVDGEPTDFRRRLRGGERVAVFPAFATLDLPGVRRLREAPAGPPRFVLDVHLGRLARYLRLLGFDALYRTDYDDATIAALARAESRTVLTRDRALLKHNAVASGHWLRATDPRRQLEEVVRAFDLADRLRPFTRCLRCNDLLQPVPKDEVAGRLPPRVEGGFDDFVRCRGCGQVYWRGTHYRRLQRIVAATTGAA